MKEIIELIISAREKTVAYRDSLSNKERRVVDIFSGINDGIWYILGLFMAHYLW